MFLSLLGCTYLIFSALGATDTVGLGKTIISLALILVNPAPEMPPSGSQISSLDNIPASHRVTWDKSLYWRTSAGCSKRGRILSRGTLVICNVSLVGQWVEEAKSKLKDPGIIYCYYGAKRKRDPVLLAKNAIVVTTYETLASVRATGLCTKCCTCKGLF